jgi:hypothetical protein
VVISSRCAQVAAQRKKAPNPNATKGFAKNVID